MIKRTIIYVVVLTISLCAAAQTQTGYVKTRGRLVNGNVVGRWDTSASGWRTDCDSHKLSQVKKTSLANVVGDSGRKNLYFATYESAGATFAESASFMFRHGKMQTNLGFADAHVETVSWGDLKNIGYTKFFYKLAFDLP